MGKTKRKKPEGFTVTQVGALVESFEKEFRVFGERQLSIIEKLDATHERVVKNTEDMAVLKTAIRSLVVKIEALTVKVDKNTEAITELTKNIKDLVKTKTDREDFLTLERRVGTLESKVASLPR